MLKLVHDADDANEGGVSGGSGASPTGRSLLDEIVRDGARKMLAAAPQAEVADYISAHTGEVDTDGRRLVRRWSSSSAPDRGYRRRRSTV